MALGYRRRVSFGERARRVLMGDDGGIGALVGTVLLLGVGVVLTFTAVQDIRVAVASAPKRIACADFVENPTQAKWVVLEGCRLDLNYATSRRWKGWFNRADAGSTARYLELFIPVSPLGTKQPETPTVVLATTDSTLLQLVEALDRIPPEQIDAFVDAKSVELEALLAPKELRGSVAPIKSTGSRPALAQMAAENAVVIEQGREPKRAEALCTLLMGLGVMLFAFWPVARRFQLERELASMPPMPSLLDSSFDEPKDPPPSA